MGGAGAAHYDSMSEEEEAPREDPAPKTSGMGSPPARSRSTPTATPIAKQAPTPSAELHHNDEIPLELPHHLFTWKDPANNNRVTLMILLPVGTTNSMLVPRIVAGGTEVTVDFEWPSTMLHELVPMFMGSRDGQKVYAKGHNKITNFRNSVKYLRRGDIKSVVKSVFRIGTPFMVEEQFTRDGVPSSVSIIKFLVGGDEPTTAKCLVLEMMGVRDNYVVADEIKEFCYDLDSLSLDD